uniref:Uncharacterized protein n=1 Tax=Moniliophthora roreri TaxID=221103 RepID=A0A0W0EYZ7_MONRR
MITGWTLFWGGVFLLPLENVSRPLEQ